MNRNLSRDISATTKREFIIRVTEMNPVVQNQQRIISVLPKRYSPAIPVTAMIGKQISNIRMSATTRLSSSMMAGWW